MERRGDIGKRVQRSPLLRVIAIIALGVALVAPGIPFISGSVASAAGTTPSRATNFSMSCTTPNNSSGQASLTFTPGSDGGSAITNYKYSFDNITFTAFNPATTTQPFVFDFAAYNRPLGVMTYIYIKAVNANGDGESNWGNVGGSNSRVGCTLGDGLPSRPLTGMTATAGNGSASVAFEAGSNGGSAITNYKYSIDGGVTYIALSPARATSPITIPGLTNGVLTTIYIKAVNANGDSTSARTVTVTPVASGSPATPTTTAAPGSPATPTTTVAPGSPVDTGTPGSPSTKPDLVASSDSGISDTDDITFDNSPTISVANRINGYTVKVIAVKDSKTMSCTFIASPKKSSCTLGTLSDGVWSVRSQQSLGDVTLPKSTVLKITIDTVDPTVISFTTPVASGEKKVGDEIKIVATVGESIVPGGSITVTLDIGVDVVLTQTTATKMEGIYVVKDGDSTDGLTVDSFVKTSVPTDIAGNVMTTTKLPKGKKNIGGLKDIVISGTSKPSTPVEDDEPTVLECKTVATTKKPTAPVLVGEKLSDGIIFDPASPQLDSVDKKELDRVAKVMAKRGGLVLISGFARNNGVDSAAFLKNLSLARARNVSKYLVAKGVRVSVRYEGYGAVTKEIGTSSQRKVDLRWIDDAAKIETEQKCSTK